MLIIILIRVIFGIFLIYVHQVNFNEGLNDIVEEKLPEVVVRGDIQLFQEIILQIGVVLKLVSPSQGLSQHKEHLLEISN
jgi:hypothetical protein